MALTRLQKEVLVSYRQSLCSSSHTFLRQRPFRLSTVDFRLLRSAENFKYVWLGLNRRAATPRQACALCDYKVSKTLPSSGSEVMRGHVAWG